MKQFLEAHRWRVTQDGMLDFSPDPNKTLADRVNRLIDTALEADNAKQTPRGYLGGSRLGVECLRALYYEYSHAPKDEGKDFPGRVLRRFRMGHWHEDETAQWLKKAGFELRTQDRNGQFGFGVAPHPQTGEPRLAGHIDGVLVNGPEKLPYPLLWEHKIMNNKYWRACNDKGVKVSHPVYYAQCQVYMGYMDLHNALFMAVNTDTSELLTQLISFDAAQAQYYSDRGVRVISTQEASDLPRIAREPTDYRCRWCSYAKRCWEAHDNNHNILSQGRKTVLVPWQKNDD